jgi:DNA polymerase-3 subunit delta
VILKGAAAARFLARPDPAALAVLIAAADPMRAAQARADLVLAWVGPAGAGEMRVTRLAAAEVRRDPAQLVDALKAVGFFPGPRAVVLEDAGDGLDATIGAAMAAQTAADARLVVTAGDPRDLKALRARFERSTGAVAVTFYDDPPGAEEIAAEMARAGIAALDPAAAADLAHLAAELEPGDFRQTLARIALYKLGDPAPLSAAELRALAPLTVGADVEAAVLAAADGREDEVVRLMRRLEGQGETPVGLCLAAQRHFRALLAAAVGPGGAVRGGWPQREAIARQARAWGERRLAAALSLLVETDLTLRSTSRAPGLALVERAFLRLAALARARDGY